MSKYCNICMTDVRFDINCERCHHNICLSCFSQVDICPFCRHRYGSELPSKWLTMIGQLNMSIKRLYALGLVR